jgi:hypothetical protein
MIPKRFLISFKESFKSQFILFTRPFSDPFLVGNNPDGRPMPIRPLTGLDPGRRLKTVMSIIRDLQVSARITLENAF